MGKVKYTMMTEKDFDQIKTLIGLNLNATQVHEITKRSWGVISLVKKSDTWLKYKNERTAIKANYTKTPKSVELPQANTPISTIHAMQERIAVANERQADALEQLVKAWQTPNNNLKGGFQLFKGKE